MRDKSWMDKKYNIMSIIEALETTKQRLTVLGLSDIPEKWR